MGTKVECKTYIRGCFDIADSSVNSNCNVLPYHEENKPSVHLSDKFTIISSNGSVHYDKEMLKRTMLVHEATFRKQVYELHRLYRIQEDLMARCQREEGSGCPRYADTLQPRSYASQAPSGDARVWQTGIAGHDLKQSSKHFMNESSSQYSVNGAPLRHDNVRSRKKMLDLQLPADAYADDDDDDDVEILDERPFECLPRANGSVIGGNVKLNLGNSEGSSHVKSWITDIHPNHSPPARILNKPAEESSNVKMTEFHGLGISASQNQHHVSHGVNLNLLNLQGNSKEKPVDEVSGSRFFCENEEIRHTNLLRHIKDEPNASTAWLKYKPNHTDSSLGHYSSTSASTYNHVILTSHGFNYALNSPWQSNTTNYLTKSHYEAVDTAHAKNALSNGILMNLTPNTSYHHLMKVHGESKHQKLPPVRDHLKDINLNDAPADAIATWEQGNENLVVDIPWLRKKPVDLMKSQVISSCANGHSQILVSPTICSEGKTTTRIPGLPISAAADKDSQCSPTLQHGIDMALSIEREADMKTQAQNKKAGTSIRNLIDLNEALPIMDDLEADLHESEGDIVPHKPDDLSKDCLAITAAESLVAMCNHVVQPGSPQLDTLHWFANLATLENTKFDNDSDDDFEALTLKLQETKTYEHHSAPQIRLDECNDDHCSAASLLVSKPQRGKARGRRQKKDFQRDVLPVLASLLKQEISEDLHTLGRSKPVTPAKRGGRNGQQWRGRRPARSVAVAVEEAKVSPPSVPPALVSANLDADALGITRWGRTTRRCRRPRCPPVMA